METFVKHFIPSFEKKKFVSLFPSIQGRARNMANLIRYYYGNGNRNLLDATNLVIDGYFPKVERNLLEIVKQAGQNPTLTALPTMLREYYWSGKGLDFSQEEIFALRSAGVIATAPIVDPKETLSLAFEPVVDTCFREYVTEVVIPNERRELVSEAKGVVFERLILLQCCNSFRPGAPDVTLAGVFGFDETLHATFSHTAKLVIPKEKYSGFTRLCVVNGGKSPFSEFQLNFWKGNQPAIFGKSSSQTHPGEDLIFVIKAGTHHVLVKCQFKFLPRSKEGAEAVSRDALPKSTTGTTELPSNWICLRLAIIFHSHPSFLETAVFEGVQGKQGKEFVVRPGMMSSPLLELFVPDFNTAKAGGDGGAQRKRERLEEGEASSCPFSFFLFSFFHFSFFVCLFLFLLIFSFPFH